ncbi:N-acetylmuramoyl-L-alanine amidase [Corynebacterium sp. NPDC060344]|uniref:N-acetylmuramoyl-L-alanine amidase n=1 Tax=Corynebacterium sp. NPDC060344 TaxID=3347101 RepID=UPI003660513C
MTLSHRRPRARIVPALLITACALLASACTIDGGTAASGDDTGAAAGTEETVASHSTRATTARPSPSAPGPETTPAPEAEGATLEGRTIHLDPGHAAVMPEGNPQVVDGRGGMKPCQVTGTAAADGWPEHTFNWLIAEAIREGLEARGATVTMSRPDDSGPADCIDERARKENASDADLVVSLHADGAGEGNRGFHVIAIADPLPGNDADGSLQLAEAIRDAFVGAGFAPSNYLGSDGIDLRADLTGLNLSEKPKALVEFGNMTDSADIAVLRSAEGRARMAGAVVAGIEAALDARG